MLMFCLLDAMTYLDSVRALGMEVGQCLEEEGVENDGVKIGGRSRTSLQPIYISGTRITLHFRGLRKASLSLL